MIGVATPPNGRGKKPQSTATFSTRHVLGVCVCITVGGVGCTAHLDAFYPRVFPGEKMLCDGLFTQLFLFDPSYVVIISSAIIRIHMNQPEFHAKSPAGLSTGGSGGGFDFCSSISRATWGRG